MAHFPSARPRRSAESKVMAVLGPTNTGKTHLAIERMCAHSSGAIGFPLRLLAREVYDRVCAIKGAGRVALITGEERIEPKDSRWLLCTVEAMPVSADLAFIALDEAQLAADRERGHVFTDRLLNARGREETMLLGSATLEPMVRALVPEAEIVRRPRFSTLSHTGAAKLSRIPPRSAIVAFSAGQVYAIAEMLRRFRGGAAVVMGALSPETRNRQVALYQSGEVDYLVATDAVGMGLNLDIGHLAFAGLSKFDGQRQRRLTAAEMAQIAGRAGRHQCDGTFGTLAGSGGHDSAFTDEEVHAIEEHRFAPLTRLFWREAQPRFDTAERLIADLESAPPRPELAVAPEAIDLAVLRRLADEPAIAATLRGTARVRRFWDACCLPDFRQQGVETHARFVARLWTDLAHGQLGADYVAQAIAMLDNPAGDIDALQGRIAAIRSWSYIAQRPDWVLAREEMAARARAAEARLSDALHARLTERFVNRRTAVLMKRMGPDAALLPVRLDGNEVLVDGEAIGRLSGFRFRVDPAAHHGDHRLLLAAAERHVPELLAARARALVEALSRPGAGTEPGSRAGIAMAVPALSGTLIVEDGEVLARLVPGRSILSPRLVGEPALAGIPVAERDALLGALRKWLDGALFPLEPLRGLDVASAAPKTGSLARALLIRLVEGGGMIARANSGIEALDKAQRTALHRLGLCIGALDIFVPAMLKPAAQIAWTTVALASGRQPEGAATDMIPVRPCGRRGDGCTAPMGYRRAGNQALRIDLAERLVRDAHRRRVASPRKHFALDPALALSMGLSTAGYADLLRQAGFHPIAPHIPAKGASGPPAPLLWRWQMPRRPIARGRAAAPVPRHVGGAFAALADLVV